MKHGWMKTLSVLCLDDSQIQRTICCNTSNEMLAQKDESLMLGKDGSRVNPSSSPPLSHKSKYLVKVCC